MVTSNYNVSTLQLHCEYPAITLRVTSNYSLGNRLLNCEYSVITLRVTSNYSVGNRQLQFFLANCFCNLQFHSLVPVQTAGYRAAYLFYLFYLISHFFYLCFPLPLSRGQAKKSPLFHGSLLAFYFEIFPYMGNSCALEA